MTETGGRKRAGGDGGRGGRSLSGESWRPTNSGREETGGDSGGSVGGKGKNNQSYHHHRGEGGKGRSRTSSVNSKDGDVRTGKSGHDGSPHEPHSVGRGNAKYTAEKSGEKLDRTNSSSGRGDGEIDPHVADLQERLSGSQIENRKLKHQAAEIQRERDVDKEELARVQASRDAEAGQVKILTDAKRAWESSKQGTEDFLKEWEEDKRELARVRKCWEADKEELSRVLQAWQATKDELEALLKSAKASSTTTPSAPAVTTPSSPAATTPSAPVATTPSSPAATTPSAPAATTPSAPAATSDDMDAGKESCRAQPKPAEKPASGNKSATYSEFARTNWDHDSDEEDGSSEDSYKGVDSLEVDDAPIVRPTHERPGPHLRLPAEVAAGAGRGTQGPRMSGDAPRNHGANRGYSGPRQDVRKVGDSRSHDFNSRSSDKQYGERGDSYGRRNGMFSSRRDSVPFGRMGSRDSYPVGNKMEPRAAEFWKDMGPSGSQSRGGNGGRDGGPPSRDSRSWFSARQGANSPSSKMS